MSTSPRALCAATLLVLCASAQALEFGFDTDAQGWTASSGASLTHQASGGNPGGFLELLDTTDDDFLLLAPTAVLGDWSAYLGGSLSFDARNINGDTPDWPHFGSLRLSSGSNVLEMDLVAAGEPPMDGAWHRYSISLSEAIWGPNLALVLADLDGLSLKGEFHDGVSEILGIDNLSINAVVPEPAAWWMLALGLPVLGRRHAHRMRLAGRVQAGACG
jgi:hypothetical protein